MNQNFKKYIMFWLSQSISQLGSAMTGFALILWIYSIQPSAMTVSLLSFCNYVPYVLVSLFAGAFVDTHKKKKILLISDSIAAGCTLLVLILFISERLKLCHIYVINCVTGFANAFQSPASNVAFGILVPEDKLANASGMSSFSNSLISIFAPVLAASLFGFCGLAGILFFDIGSFFLAFVTLLFFIQIPERKRQKTETGFSFAGWKEGYLFLLRKKGIMTVILTMAMLNFFSRLTYENILPPMILARSGGNQAVLGLVNAAMGLGGILGGIFVSAGKAPKDSVKSIYVSAGISFLFGDLLMGLGQSPVLWALAGFMASFPIPFINAGQNVILYKFIPEPMQGRIFSIRNAFQFGTIPAGILLGGFLADYVLEPYMNGNAPGASFLRLLTGSGAGTGMAVMFLCTGILGGISSFLFYHKKEVQGLK